MKTILVVEDERASAGAIELALERAGYHVVLAADGQAALDVLAHIRPHLILSDVKMPRIGGLELGQDLKADPDYATIPIILMSAVSVPHSQLTFQPAAILEKPIMGLSHSTCKSGTAIKIR